MKLECGPSVFSFERNSEFSDADNVYGYPRLDLKREMDISNSTIDVSIFTLFHLVGYYLLLLG